MFGNTVQLYTTPKCAMHCPHCSSKLQQMEDMSIRTFEQVVRNLNDYGVSRVELFANDPLLHPDVLKQIEVLNESGLNYALLTVGASPTDKEVEKLLMKAIKIIDPTRGGLVFSVDFTEEMSVKIFASGQGDLWPYAFKATTFWRLARLFKSEGVSVRTNTVISVRNYDEVPEIMRQVAEMGFATSFCLAQTVRPEFLELSQEGLTGEKEKQFRDFLNASGILDHFEINQTIKETREIINHGELIPGANTSFNKFRGGDTEESCIPPEKLEWLKQKITNLKKEHGDLVLPNEGFINSLGERGIGCLELLRQEKFPQLKIGPTGEMRFCCDLHDERTESYFLNQFYEPETREAFLAMVRKNPYIWLCLYFNPCSFSVNYVDYKTKG